MTVLLDFNPVVIAKAATATSKLGAKNVDIQVIKNYFFRDLLYLRKYFRDHDEFVICRDSKSNWRKDFFPYYKIARKDLKANLPFDWEMTKDAMDEIGDDLVNYFPYKVVMVDKAEADDVIGALTKHIRRWDPETGITRSDNPVVIGSRDNDFLSLQIIPGVTQYSPIDQKYIREPNPEDYLARKILKGDTGDSVPNVLSEDDAIATKTRQKAITEARIETWESYRKANGELHPDLDPAKYARNKTLVDLVYGIPQEIEQACIKTYQECKPTTRIKTASFFIKNRMPDLHAELQHF